MSFPEPYGDVAPPAVTFATVPVVPERCPAQSAAAGFTTGIAFTLIVVAFAHALRRRANSRFAGRDESRNLTDVSRPGST